MTNRTRRQQRRARKVARQKRRREKKAASLSARHSPAEREKTLSRRCTEAAAWPLHEVRIADGWENPWALCQVLVARRAPDGRVAAALFLVDLGCLGAKDAVVHVYRNAASYGALRRKIEANLRMRPCDLALAAKVVREGIRYARSLGFEPHRDATTGLPLLEGAEDCDVQVPLGGPDGRPLFLAGPHDDVARIQRTLDERLGPEGYGRVTGADLPPQGASASSPEVERTLLLEFAEAVMPPPRPFEDEEGVEARLQFVAHVWNTVVDEQLGLRTAAYLEGPESDDALGDDAEQALHEVLPSMRAHKLEAFGEHLLWFEDVEVQADEAGGYRIQFRVSHPAPQDAR